MSDEEFGKRFRQAFGGIKNKEIADKLGVVPSAVQGYLGGRVPQTPILLKITEITGCDLHWLLTGENSRTVNREAAPKSESILNMEVLEGHIRRIVREEIGNPANATVQQLGTVDEFLAESIRRHDDPAAVLKEWYAREDWPLQELSVPEFKDWGEMTLEQKINEIKSHRGQLVRHIKRNER